MWCVLCYGLSYVCFCWMSCCRCCVCCCCWCFWLIGVWLVFVELKGYGYFLFFYYDC